MSGEGQDPPRAFRNLEGLLKFCVQSTSSEDPNSSNQNIPIDPERQEWLQNVLNSMSVSVVEEMLKKLDVLKVGVNAVTAGTATEETFHSLEETLDSIMEHTDSMDNANDFHKIGGFDVLPDLLATPHAGVRAKTAELIADLAQNNPYCQNKALEAGLLPVLLHILDSDIDETACIKALYAVSCLSRHNPDVEKQFDNEDGLSVLLRAMQRPIEKLRVKSAFLITHLCNQQPFMRDTLFKMGFVEQLAALLQSEHDSSHEHLLSALLSLVSQHEASREECARPELKIKDVLEERVNLFKGKDECAETIDYCMQLLSLCFNQTPSLEIER